MEDIIDQRSSGSTQVPQAVKTLGIISIIGSSFWGLICLIALFWLMSQAGAAAGILRGPLADLLTLIYVFLILMAGLNGLGIMAAVKMMKGKKSSFILYAVVTGIWALLLIFGSLSGEGNPALGVLSGVISLGFIVGFGMQMKNMPA